MFRIRFLPLAVLIILLTASTAYTDIWYRDADGDGYGDNNDWLEQPTQPAGYVAMSGDCDDTTDWIYPGAPEYVGDGVDSNCDSMEDCFEDLDTDGYGSSTIVQSSSGTCSDYGVSGNNADCDDTDSSVYPGAPEIVGDGVDQDCNGYEDCYLDLDVDSYGSSSVAADAVIPDGGNACVVFGYSDNSIDCDDLDAGIRPDAAEIWYDGIDQNCDAANDFDADADSYVAIGYESETSATAPNTGDCDDALPQVNPGAVEICGDGLDNDCDAGTSDICAALGITAITDVGNDQGGQVRIAWTRAADDEPGAAESVTAYDIYRRIDAYKAAGGDDAATAEKAWPAGDWDFVAQIPSSGEETYHAIVPTLCDSTDTGICWSVFFLRARTASPFVFADCAPDSGYSIDNLAPEAPLNLAAAYAAENVSLTWDESEAGDFGYFRIYRSADPDFVPAPELLVRNTTATSWTDPVEGGWGLHYKVAAVDFAGNEGPPASVQQASGSDLPSAGARLALHPNVPNPFNPSTTIEFELPDARRVRLEIFSLDGRRIAVLAEGWRSPGLHREVWNGRADDGRPVASGAYLYRLDAGNRVLTRRLLLVK